MESVDDRLQRLGGNSLAYEYVFSILAVSLIKSAGLDVAEDCKR